MEAAIYSKTDDLNLEKALDEWYTKAMSKKRPQ
jgi:hypothetical protein